MSRSISSYLRQGARFLQSAGVPEANISAEELLSRAFSQSRCSLYLNFDVEVDDSNESKFQALLTKRATRYPLQYLLRRVPFRTITLEVGEGCLIPRPETEILVDVVLQNLGEEFVPLNVLDVGTGSGNIAISLAKERPNWLITATDVSDEALRYARANAGFNHVQNQIRFVQTDLWEKMPGPSFDALVSNPPYLTQRELECLQPEVAFEPRIALDGGEDGLCFFRAIIREAKSVLKPHGFIFFEVGMGQAQAVSKMLKTDGFDIIRISRDLSGVERIVSGRLMHHG